MGEYAVALDTKEKTVDFVTFNTNKLSFGYEPIFNVSAKHAELNKLSTPLQGNAGVYILKPVNRTTDQAPFNAQEIKTKLAQDPAFVQLQQATLYVLQEKMNVVDNRVKFW